MVDDIGDVREKSIETMGEERNWQWVKFTGFNARFHDDFLNKVLRNGLEGSKGDSRKRGFRKCCMSVRRGIERKPEVSNLVDKIVRESLWKIRRWQVRWKRRRASFAKKSISDIIQLFGSGASKNFSIVIG